MILKVFIQEFQKLRWIPLDQASDGYKNIVLSVETDVYL